MRGIGQISDIGKDSNFSPLFSSFSSPLFFLREVRIRTNHTNSLVVLVMVLCGPPTNTTNITNYLPSLSSIARTSVYSDDDDDDGR